MEQNKKIVLITYGNFPYGGASANLLRHFCIGLTNLNNEIEVILPTGNYYGNQVDRNKKRNGKIDDVKYKYLCFSSHPKNLVGKIADNLCGLILPFFYLLKKTFNKELDIVIAYDSTFFTILLLLIAKIALRKKLVIILPEFYEKSHTKFFSISLIKWYGFFLSLRYLVKYADGFIVVSYFLKNFVENTLSKKKSVVVMPNVIDPKKFESKKIKPHIKDKITIGYVGTPTRKDGAMDLIKSFSVLNKKYSNTHLLIIGDITNGKSIIPILKEYATELGVLDNITFTGLVSYTLIPKLLHSCQILALTRPNGIFAEAGFPTKLGEYFACKKPVVLTKVGDMPKYFKDEEHVILVEPENIDSITKGFEKLIFDHKLAEKLSNNAYAWMNKNLNNKNVAGNIDRFLNTLLNTSTG